MDAPLTNVKALISALTQLAVSGHMDHVRDYVPFKIKVKKRKRVSKPNKTVFGSLFFSFFNIFLPNKNNNNMK